VEVVEKEYELRVEVIELLVVHVVKDWVLVSILEFIYI
jgi:hypothetical protein